MQDHIVKAPPATDPDNGFWVFGYGSLMWKTGFAYTERRIARLEGYRRRFALTSIRYRGSPEVPGLVLGLDWAPGASCTGVAFRVCPSVAQEVRSYLSDRELITRSYFEIAAPVRLLCAGTDADTVRDSEVDAICYVLDRTHEQYAGDLTLEQQAARILAAVGPMGPNIEYFRNTIEHLRELDIEDAELASLARVVESMERGQPPMDGLTGS